MTDFADISSYQAGADMAVYAAAGHDRILIKATEGVGYTNPFFAGWWAAAGQAGLARGAYHFARPSRTDAVAEADHFVSVVQAAGGLGPRDWLCLDVEDTSERGVKAAEHAAAFCARMVELGFPGGLIYSGTWYLGPAGLTAEVLPPGWQWLHLANYTRTDDADLSLPLGWVREQVLARQWTETAEQDGIPGKSDRNRVLREWLPSVARAVEEDDVRPSEWTVEDRRVVGRAILDELWADMQARPAGAPDSWYPPRQAHAGGLLRRDYEMTGDAVGRLSAVQADTAAIRAALADVLGPDHPASEVLVSRPLTVDDVLALAPVVPVADAVRITAAYAARASSLIPSAPPKESS